MAGRERKAQAAKEEVPAEEGAGTISEAQASDSRADEKTVDQALAQEQKAFERNVFESRELFKLQLAMGWMTFAIVLVCAVAIVVYPPAAFAAAPVSGLSIWNWRRMLERDSGRVQVITKRPGQDE